MNVAIVISTYNNPSFLNLCLLSILKQKRMPDEVIIADDGSREETRRLIELFKPKFKNLKHVWHDDNGYQRAKVLNLAVGQATSSYIITTDQDCIFNQNFIKDHCELAEEDCMISAYRTRIKESFTNFLVKKRTIPHELKIAFNSKINIKYTLRVPFLWSKKNQYTTTKSYGTFGCNMSFWKKDFLEVNGFDESFVGWGPEDSEFTQRLLNKGVRRKMVFYGAIAYHLHHPELSREMVAANKQILQKTIDEKSTWTFNGLVKTTLPLIGFLYGCFFSIEESYPFF